MRALKNYKFTALGRNISANAALQVSISDWQ
jgi:hypothetical protein